MGDDLVRIAQALITLIAQLAASRKPRPELLADLRMVQVELDRAVYALGESLKEHDAEADEILEGKKKQ